MSIQTRMQLLKMLENRQLTPQEALARIRELANQAEGEPKGLQTAEAASSGLKEPQTSARLTESGRAAEQAGYAKEHAERAGAQPAAAMEQPGSVQALLAAGVSAILKVPAARIQPDEPLKNFGFDSISFTAFHNYIAEKLEISLSPDVFFEYESIRALSEYLLEHHGTEAGIKRLYTAPAANGYVPDGPAQLENAPVPLEAKAEPALVNAFEPAPVPATEQEGGADSLWLIEASDEFFMDFWKRLPEEAGAAVAMRPLPREELPRLPYRYTHLLVRTSDGPKMEVVLSGRGKPLVIVGGVGMAAPMVLHQLDYFSRNRQVICIHNPGCGLSENIADYSLEERARVAADVLDTLGLTEPVDFVGISWGGMLGQYFSLMYPERVSTLTLVSSIYEIVNENPSMNAQYAMLQDLAAVEGGMAARELLESGQSIDARTFAKYMDYYLPGSDKSYTTLDILEKIAAPVLVVYGKRDTIINNRQSRMIIEKVAGARHMEMEDAAHFLFMTHHDRLNAAIDDFISGQALAASGPAFRIRDMYPQIGGFEQRRKEELAIRGMEEYEGLETSLNELCASYAYRFLKESGIDTAEGAIHDRGEWVKRLGILPSHMKLFDCLIDMLEEDGLVRCLDSKVKFLKDERLVADPSKLYEACLEKYAPFEGMLRFLDYCVSRYKDALSGRIPPVSVLFPKGSSEALEKSNRDTVEHGRERVYAKVAADILELLLSRKGDNREINILEVGGGTGLLTRQLLSIAGLSRVNYYFTDIGEYFINKAKQDPDFSGLHFRVFDISRSPSEQGLQPGSFDAVLGLNVVHATKDIAGTLGNLKKLLVQDGVVLLIEACKRLRWVDMVWGLAEGWWYFEDSSLRTKSPIIHAYAWERAFRAAGFNEACAFPQSDGERFETDCVLIAAQ